MKLIRTARAAWLLLAMAVAPAFAVPVMDMRAEDLVPMAAEFRQSLNLNANQQTLWAKVESQSKALLRERKARRDRLQEATRQGLQAQNVELRDLQKALEDEQATSAQEDRQLREWWLGINDALDDGQRQAAAKFLLDQLIRMEVEPGTHAEKPAGSEGGRRGGHGGHAGMGGPGRGM
jgi:predicted phage tail protein